MSRILVVDDEPQYGEYLYDWLTREGHEVKTAVTAEDAIDYGTSWLPSVLVADWMLASSVDGLQVSEAVRAANPRLQTILITGYPSSELKARAEKANVFSFIEKPFSLAEVAGAVRQAARAGRPQLPGAILVVSESQTIGQLARDTLRAASYKSRLATNAETALLALQEDPSIQIAILDCLHPSFDLAILADELRALRENLIVVGSSDNENDAEHLAKLGIELFLHRFWDADDLHSLLIKPIGACGECRLPLPLRWPLPGDEVSSWACSMCGARYQAVMRADASEDLQRHVRAVAQ